MISRLRALLVLSRVSNLPTVWTNVVAGCLLSYIASSHAQPAWLLLIAGASLLYCGGMVLNDVVDAEWDREHGKERPIPAGVIARTSALLIALLFLGGGTALMHAGGAALIWLVLLLACIVVYDLVHKRWIGAVMFMGGARGLLLIAANSAVVTGWPRGHAILWASALGLYTVGITLAARGEQKDSRVGAIPQVLLGAPASAAVIAWLYVGDREIGLTMAIALAAFVAWVLCCLVVFKRKRDGHIGRGVAMLIAGIVLVDICAIAFADLNPHLALWLLPALPLTLLLQRIIPGT